MKLLIINGPNLNLLGKRDTQLYGSKTLEEINSDLSTAAKKLGIDTIFFQSNSEGALIDFIQANHPDFNRGADGIIINPGALTHYSYSLRDCLSDTGLPVIEVHLSNIYKREEWRHKSVIAPIALGQITGFGYRGYIHALNLLVEILEEKKR